MLFICIWTVLSEMKNYITVHYITKGLFEGSPVTFDNIFHTYSQNLKKTIKSAYNIDLL